VKDAIDFAGLPSRIEQEVALASGRDDTIVALHHQDLRAGEFLD